MKKQLLLILSICIFIYSNAQSVYREIIKNEKGLSHHDIKLNVSEQTFFDPSKLQLILGLEPESNLELMNAETDQLGFTHYRYYQTYLNHPIENSMYIIHTKDNLITGMSGSIVLDFDEAVSNVAAVIVQSEEAITKALAFVGATVYMWQDGGMEQHLKVAMQDAEATYYPKPKLVWYNSGAEIEPRKLRLSYKINIYSQTPLKRADIFIDAETGEILGTKEGILNTDAIGTCNTAYSGIQTIHSDLSGSTYRLRDYTKGLGILTYKANGTDFTSTTSDWNLTGQDQYGLDAHFGAASTYTYYLNVHGRNSVDNAGKALISYVNESQTVNNAYWDGNAMHYGNLSGSNKGITAIDVCGHELTHGVTQYTCNLNYSYQSGAMNESLSDIFGKCTQFYTKPTDINWKLSNDMSWFIRDMANPNAYGQPDTYLGTYWATGSGDNGGVHTNSGVGNFMFYLLVTGGSGTNDIGNAYSVTGIGQNAAERVIYRTQTVYLTATSQYVDWRTACINAATDLFGATSNEVTQVQNAWHAVGIGAAGGGSSCATATGLSATAITSSSATLNWNAVSGASSYNIQYRIVGNSTWILTTSTTNSKSLTGLIFATQYEFQVQTVCSGETSAYTSSANFTTLSANGSPVYCASNGSSTAYEYIDYVSIGSISRTSGADAGGYYNGSGLSTSVTQGSVYTLTFSAGFPGSVYSESWAIYIDWNYDGDFADANETAGTFTSTGSGNNTLSITVPSTAVVALTRMRVSMRYNATPPSCGSFDYGEVEDYSLNVTASSVCGLPSGLSATDITSTTATLNWTAGTGAASYNIQYRKVGTTTWTATTSTTTSKAITGLTASTQYEFQVQTVCSSGTSSYTASANFTTLSSGGNCTENNEPTNNTKSKAVAIPVNTDFLSQISTSTDNDWWSFANTSTAKNIKVTLTTLPADYDVKLYNPSGTLIATSELSGTSNETIIYNTSTVGTYKIKVYGWAGAYSNTQCYTLKASISSTPFKLEEGNVFTKSDKTQFTLFPNPATDQINLRYQGEDQDAIIRITNIMGQVISTASTNLSAGINLHFDISGFSNGKYFISISGNEINEVKMFEVIR